MTEQHASSPAGTGDDDVVVLLARQHEDIRRHFDAVEGAVGRDRKDAFHRLVRLLAIHETAEEEIVHPYVRRQTEAGAETVRQRLEEERQAKELLGGMERMDVDDAAFARNLQSLRSQIEAHADAEERHEFDLLQTAAGPGERRRMASAVRAVEAVAPTRPHPGVESAAQHALLGPLVSMVDRTRDAIARSKR